MERIRWEEKWARTGNGGMKRSHTRQDNISVDFNFSFMALNKQLAINLVNNSRGSQRKNDENQKYIRGMGAIISKKRLIWAIELNNWTLWLLGKLSKRLSWRFVCGNGCFNFAPASTQPRFLVLPPLLLTIDLANSPLNNINRTAAILTLLFIFPLRGPSATEIYIE